MKKHALTELSVAELANKRKQAQEELYSWEEQVLAGTEKNYAKLRSLRQEIARISTVMKEKKAKKNEEKVA